MGNEEQSRLSVRNTKHEAEHFNGLVGAKPFVMQFAGELLAAHSTSVFGQIAEDDVISMHRLAPLGIIFIGSDFAACSKAYRHDECDHNSIRAPVDA
jgi:hypothetical protein